MPAPTRGSHRGRLSWRTAAAVEACCEAVHDLQPRTAMFDALATSPYDRHASDASSAGWKEAETCTYHVRASERGYVAYCREKNLGREGSTVAHAIQALRTAIAVNCAERS